MVQRTNYPYFITEDDLSGILNGQEHALPPACISRLKTINTHYDLLPEDERDKLILSIIKYLDRANLSRTTEKNLEVFEKGWEEVYERCLAEGISFSALKPQYTKPYTYLRFNGNYIAPENPYLIDDLITLVLLNTFSEYFGDVDYIFEFGCGTGQYIYLLRELFPDKRVIGLDWTKSSQNILNLMAQEGKKIKGLHFDMLNPDYEIVIPPNCAVFTMAALEQLYTNYQYFLNYLLTQKPRFVIHHEPIEEFYHEDTLFDYLGLCYHRKRRYLSGFLTTLREYEKKGLVKIIQAKRLPLGNPYIEAVSQIVWMPI